MKEVESNMSAIEMFIAFVKSLLELVREMGGAIAEKSLSHLIQTVQGKRTFQRIARTIVGYDRLHLIDDTMSIDQCDGERTLKRADDVFASSKPSFLELDPVDLTKEEIGLDKIIWTYETPVEIYEMREHGIFSQIFSSILSDVRRLCFTQHQIINFVQKYREWLWKNNHEIFFLFESFGQLFVAFVYFGRNDSLRDRPTLRVYRFSSTYFWEGNFHALVAIPKSAYLDEQFL
jgi:hypothetical protein